MKKINKTIFVLVLVFIFIIPLFNLPFIKENISNSKQRNSKNPPTIESPVYEEPDDKNRLKTANNPLNEHNFSFNTNITEKYSWDLQNRDNGTWFYINGTQGYNVTYRFTITSLRNSTNDLINPSDLGYIAITYYNGTDNPTLSYISDYGVGGGLCSGFIELPKYFPWNVNVFMVQADEAVKFNATMEFVNNITQNITTDFNPTKENTKPDDINWELSYQNYIAPFFSGNYRANLTIESFSNFTLREVKGKVSGYWKPVDYIINIDNVITIIEDADEYLIELQTTNFVSIMYNDNLTFKTNNNELHLYVTCKMAGNLSIRFKLTNGTIINRIYSYVKEDQTIHFNYEMLKTTPGGMGYLNITLLNNSKIIFGVKIAEVEFHKQAIFVGFTEDTYAFDDGFVVGGFYIDLDFAYYLIGEKGYTDMIEVMNITNIANANVTYELEEYGGVLDYMEHPDPTLNIYLYMKMVNLRELILPAGDYNLTQRGTKFGYDCADNVTTFEIFKRPAQITISTSNSKFTMEEDFSITVNLMVFYSEFDFEYYLKIPAYVNLTFTNNDTGISEGGPMTYPIPIVQSFTISDVISNDTIPGKYELNVTLISDYYYATDTFYVDVVKKNLGFSFAYDDDDLEEDEEFDISWSLENGGFNGNRENMSVEIFVDGGFFARYELSGGSGGVITLKLDDGEHTITCSLISPFYSAATTITIDVEEKEEEELTWMEENWIFLLIGIISIIAMVILAMFLLISRQKMKAQRELDSELMALKNKATSTEQKISLIETQMAQIASIYWLLVVHSEQGTTMVEIVDFKFEDILSEEEQHIIGKGTVRDSALIGGFLTAIRNFSRETSGESQDYQPIFNSETDYTTVVDDTEIHRRILEGTDYFMGFVSSSGTIEISDVLSNVNSNFNENYGVAAKNFDGAVIKFKPFVNETITYLHDEIRELQKRLDNEQFVLERDLKNLKEVQDKIGIVKKSGSTYK